MEREEFERLVKDEMDLFVSKVRVNLIKKDSHQVVMIEGIENEPELIRSLAIYMVALIANAIEANLQIRADLLVFDEIGLEEIMECVIDTIGEDNNLDLDFIQDERNPWLAEAIIHLLLTVSNSVENLHPVGEILAVGLVHDDPKDKGLDLTAFYNSNGLGLTIGECKAYKTDPNKAISNAMKFFDGIDTNRKTGKRIRTQVQILRAFLSDELNQQVTEKFWKDRKCYLITPIYDDSVNVNWNRNRNTTLGRLNVPLENRVIIPIGVNDFDRFFDSIANEMRNFIGEFSNV